jgi:hypothetical protein
MLHRLIRPFAQLLDLSAGLITLSRLRWITAPIPRTPLDRIIQEEREQLRQAFPEIDFDDPKPRRHRPIM